MPIPMNEPMLILRDPPSGSSSVTYQNVQTSLKLSIENYKKFRGINADGGLDVVVEGEGKMCYGMGFKTCLLSYKSKFSAGGHFQSKDTELEEYKEDRVSCVSYLY